MKCRYKIIVIIIIIIIIITACQLALFIEKMLLSVVSVQ